MRHPGKGQLLFFIKVEEIKKEEEVDKEPAWRGVFLHAFRRSHTPHHMPA